MAPAVRQILGSYQKTFLESNRIGPGKRSCTKHQLVGKVLSFFPCCARGAGRGLCLVFEAVPAQSPLPPPAPSRAAGKRSRESRTLAWQLSHSAGGLGQDWNPRLRSLFPDLLPNGMNKSVLLSHNFPIKYFDALRRKAVRALLYYQTLFHPLPGCKLQPSKNGGMQVLFMTFLGTCGQMHTIQK